MIGDVSATEPAPARERCVPLTLRRGFITFIRALPYTNIPFRNVKRCPPDNSRSPREHRSDGGGGIVPPA